MKPLKYLPLLLLLAIPARAQISGAGQLTCNGATNTGTVVNSATANNTVLASVSSTAAYAYLVQLNQTTTITGGAISFQTSNDNGTNFANAAVTQVVSPSTGAQLTNPYTLVASTNQAFLVILAGASSFQIKLTTALTGTGAVTPFYTAICTQPTLGPLTLDANGNLLVNVKAQSLAQASTNVAQFGGTNVSTGTGASGAGIPRVTVSNDSSSTGTLGDNGAAAATNRFGELPCIYRNDLHGGTAATTGRDGAPDCGTDGLLHTALLPDLSVKRYRASSKFAASSTTDNWRISGNASNTVIVTKINSTCTQTTAGTVNYELRKESTAVSGGTSATVTNLPIDSGKSAAQSVVNSFTLTGPTRGTLVADIDNQQVDCPTTGSASGVDLFATITAPGAPVAVLRGANEGLAIDLGGAVTGGNITVTVEWMEVTTITP